MMAKGSTLQNSFHGGEWSAFSQIRIDVPQHDTAMQVCYNSIPLEEGVVTRRPGFAWAGWTAQGLPTRTFDISPDGTTPLTMEIGAGQIRFRIGLLSCFNNTSAVSAISTATPAVITVVGPPFYWATGTVVEFLVRDVFTNNVYINAAGVQACAYLASKKFVLTKLTSNTFSLTDEVTGLPVNGSYINFNASCVMSVQDIVSLSAPYQASDLPFLRIVQAENQVYVLHPTYPPYVLTITPYGAITKNSFVPTIGNLIYSFEQVTFVDGPYLDPSEVQELTCVTGVTAPSTNLLSSYTGGSGTPANNLNMTNGATAVGSLLGIPSATGSNVTPPSVSGTVQLSVSSVADLNGGIGFQSTDVGRLMRMNCEPPPYNAYLSYSQGDPVTYNSGYYVCTGNLLSGSGSTNQIITGQQVYNLEPDTNPISWAVSSSVNTWTWGWITQVLNSQSVMFSVAGPPIMYPGTAMTYAMGKYSTTTGWPACGCYYQGRLWLGGAIPNSFDGSVSNNIFFPNVLAATPQQVCFSPTDNNPNATFPYLMPGVVLDSSAISETLNAVKSSQIVWMLPNEQGIIVGTPSGEYLVQGPGTGVITPTNIAANPITAYCCASVEPRRTGITSVFVQKFKRRLQEFVTDVFSGKLFAPNLNEFSRHMTVPGISEIGCVEEKSPTTWCRLAAPVTINGQQSTLVGTTYRRISRFATEPPKFNGWHRHSHGAGSSINYITTGPSMDRLADALTVTTTNPMTGMNSIEIMMPIFEEDDPITSAWFLDQAKTPVAAATSITGFPAGGFTLMGLDYLQQQPVTVFLAGLNCGTFTPNIQGQIFVPYGSDPDGYLSYAWVTNLSNSTIYGQRGMPIDNGALTAPCVVGYPYVSQGQVHAPAKPVPGSDGPLLGKTRRIHMFNAIVQGAISGSISFGVDFAASLLPAYFNTPGFTAYDQATLYDGVFPATGSQTLSADYNFDNALAWQITGPYPGTIIAVETHYQPEDRN